MIVENKNENGVSTYQTKSNAKSITTQNTTTRALSKGQKNGENGDKAKKKERQGITG